jgi:hypothetical protein
MMNDFEIITVCRCGAKAAIRGHGCIRMCCWTGAMGIRGAHHFVRYQMKFARAGPGRISIFNANHRSDRPVGLGGSLTSNRSGGAIGAAPHRERRAVETLRARARRGAMVPAVQPDETRCNLVQLRATQGGGWKNEATDANGAGWERRRSVPRAMTFRKSAGAIAVVGCNAMQPGATGCNAMQPGRPFGKNEPTGGVFEIASVAGGLCRWGAVGYMVRHAYEICVRPGFWHRHVGRAIRDGSRYRTQAR